MERGSNRCVCGKSSRFPLCDGDHGGADWSCTGGDTIPVAVLGAAHLQSVADRLAHHLGGVAVHRRRHLQAGRALVLTDGTDLLELRALLQRVDTPAVEALAIDVPGGAIQAALGVPVREVPTHEPLQLWRALLQALEQPVCTETLRRGFLSHAVADEARLEPVVQYLRTEFGAELFVCADSIPGGADWRASIVSSLDEAEVFVLLVSDASVRSTYCAFEAGYALAKGIPVRMVMLESVAPPAYVSHLQGIDVPRSLARRPWLSADEALAEALLEALAG